MRPAADDMTKPSQVSRAHRHGGNRAEPAPSPVLFLVVGRACPRTSFEQPTSPTQLPALGRAGSLHRTTAAVPTDLTPIRGYFLDREPPSTYDAGASRRGTGGCRGPARLPKTKEAAVLLLYPATRAPTTCQ